MKFLLAILCCFAGWSGEIRLGDNEWTATRGFGPPDADISLASHRILTCGAAYIRIYLDSDPAVVVEVSRNLAAVQKSRKALLAELGMQEEASARRAYVKSVLEIQQAMGKRLGAILGQASVSERKVLIFQSQLKRLADDPNYAGNTEQRAQFAAKWNSEVEEATKKAAEIRNAIPLLEKESDSLSEDNVEVLLAKYKCFPRMLSKGWLGYLGELVLIEIRQDGLILAETKEFAPNRVLWIRSDKLLAEKAKFPLTLRLGPVTVVEMRTPEKQEDFLKFTYASPDLAPVPVIGMIETP